MAALERIERGIVAVLAVSLAAGIGIAEWRRPRALTPVRIEKFSVDTARPASVAYKVDINSSDAEALALLKGVGPVLAQRIVDYRSSNGLFIAPEDIMKVRGVGPALYGRIKEDIRTE